MRLIWIAVFTAIIRFIFTKLYFKVPFITSGIVFLETFFAVLISIIIFNIIKRRIERKKR